MTLVKLLNLYLQNVRSPFLSQNLCLTGNSTLLAATFSGPVISRLKLATVASPNNAARWGR